MTLEDAFRHQARACTNLGSPFMGQLCMVLANTWPRDTTFGQLCANWPGDLTPNGASLPLRIAGGLHALVRSGQDVELATVYPPNVSDNDALRDAVHAAMERHADFLTAWVQNAPQTNEVRRAAALIAAAQWIGQRHPLPFVTSELGASAGLNLMWDQFALSVGGKTYGPEDAVLKLTPDWDGAHPPVSDIQIAERRGVDLNPLDIQDPDHTLRLYSYLWPDQPHRIELTRAAIAAHAAAVDKADAIDWLADRLKTPRPGHLHLIYHTIAWQYFPDAAQARGAALIEAAGEQASEEAPLAWLRMENDGGASGARLDLRLWPGDHHIALGRADFHGRWISWSAP